MLLTSKSSASGVAPHVRVPPCLSHYSFSVRWNWNVFNFSSTQKHRILDLFGLGTSEVLQLSMGSGLCVRPSMYHVIQWRSLSAAKRKAKKCIILLFFLSSVYNWKQLLHAYKILTRNSSFINKPMLSLEKFCGTGARRIFLCIEVNSGRFWWSQ